MSLNNNSQNINNAQLIQQRLKVREQEVSALKTQNRHLLEKLESVEKSAKPNQINTHLVAQEVQKHLEPVIADMQNMMKSSFEILQSTMRGIYQQSQRAQQAVEESAAQSRDLEIRMNEQRKTDQNFYQDKIFSMIAAFCDRIERQIEIRLKALATVELLNTKQNEVLEDVESMKGLIASIQKNSESGRGEIARIDRNISEANEKLLDVQMQTQNTESLIRDTLQQIENHRAEFRVIRQEIKGAADTLTNAAAQMESNSMISNASAKPNVNGAGENVAEDENQIIQELIVQKHNELESLEKNIEAHGAEGKDDVTMILALLRAQKNELQKVAQEAKAYIKNAAASDSSELTIEKTDDNALSESNLT